MSIEKRELFDKLSDKFFLRLIIDIVAMLVLVRFIYFRIYKKKDYLFTFFLFNIIVAFGIGIVVGVLEVGFNIDASLLISIYQLAILIPSLAVGVRRMHDSGRSGWWLIMPVMNLVFAIAEGTAGPNKYGQDPKSSSTGC